MTAFQRAGDALSRAFAALASVALFALMLTTFTDVMGRKFMRALPGGLEVSEMLMVAVIFCALPIVSWRAEHVGFELVDNIYRGAAKCWSVVMMDAISALALGALGIACWGYAARTLADGDISVYFKLPIGWFVYLMAAMLLLAALMHLLRCFTLDRRA